MSRTFTTLRGLAQLIGVSHTTLLYWVDKIPGWAPDGVVVHGGISNREEGPLWSEKQANKILKEWKTRSSRTR